MVIIKNKKITVIIAIVSCLTIINILFINIAQADELVEFKENPTYYCYKTTSGGYYYYINVTLCNNGDEDSVAIDLGIKELIGEDYEYLYPSDCKGEVLPAGKCKTYTIDWPTIESSKDIEIVYAASDIGEQADSNSGSISLTVTYDKNSANDGTPGFELFLIILSILSIMTYKKIKKNNK